MLKFVDIEITAENRDKGRKYRLTEMPALKAERWARHAIAAMSRHDLDAREEIARLGMMGFVLVGMQALAGGDIEGVDALMDQMLPQIQIIEPAVIRPLTPDGGDIWEVSTLFRLRKELIELHVGFPLAEFASILAASSARRQQSDSQNTEMSQTSSETSSAPMAGE